jgi:hypothetical protein
VEKLLPLGKAKAGTVAKALALSVRTLSRRLAGECTTYAKITVLGASLVGWQQKTEIRQR